MANGNGNGFWMPNSIWSVVRAFGTIAVGIIGVLILMGIADIKRSISDNTDDIRENTRAIQLHKEQWNTTLLEFIRKQMVRSN